MSGISDFCKPTCLEPQELDETPLTRSDMKALLQPLHSCVLRMESLLLELSDSSTQLGNFGAAKGTIAPMSLQPAGSDIHPVDARPILTTEDGHPSAPSSVELARFTSSRDRPSAVQKPPDIKPAEKPAETSGQHVTPETETISRSEKSHTMDDKDLEAVLAVIETRNISRVIHHLDESAGSILDKVVPQIENLYFRWSHLREPTRNTLISRLVTSSAFESACMVAIVLNSCLVAYVADWQIQHIGMSEPGTLDILETSLFFFFLIELLLRLGAHHLWFFVNHDMSWNIFDFVLVSISAVDFIFDKVVGEQAGSNVGFMRLLRLLKLARIFRSVRSFKFFKSLGQVLDSFRTSLTCLFWGFALIAFVLYLFALIFMQALIDYLSFTKDIDPLTRSAMKAEFGSLKATLLSLYMSVTGGNDWKMYYDILHSTGEVYGLLFVLFTFFFIFALFNIITGTLVEKAMSASKPDRADLILSQRKLLRDSKREFMDICAAMDVNRDGTISFEEFEKWMQSPIMAAYLASVGIEIADIEIFFDNVGARSSRSGQYVNTGEVTIEHFVEGCMHMRGTATAIDMQRQLFEIEILHQEVSTLTKHVKHLGELMTHGVSSATEASGIDADTTI